MRRPPGPRWPLAARLPEVNGTAPTWLILDWPDRPAGDNAAFALAFALLLAGLAAVHLFGPPVGGDEMA